MSTFWRLKEQDYYFTSIELKKIIPELKNHNVEDITKILKKSNFVFYYSEKTKIPLLIRFTIPFALLLMLIFIIGLPINFMLTGQWGYKFVWFRNWIKMLGII